MSHGRGWSFPGGWVSDIADTCHIFMTHRLVVFGTFESFSTTSGPSICTGMSSFHIGNFAAEGPGVGGSFLPALGTVAFVLGGNNTSLSELVRLLGS